VNAGFFMSKVMDLVKEHNLQAHPEGGYFKETYRSEYSTGIYYLLSKGQKSSLHRIKSDEMWHFYAGDELVVVEITIEGMLKQTHLNKNRVQHVVPAGTWFGAYLPEGAEYAFVGCTVAPAFHFKDFEMAKLENLIKEYPEHVDVIRKMI